MSHPLQYRASPEYEFGGEQFNMNTYIELIIYNHQRILTINMHKDALHYNIGTLANLKEHSNNTCYFYPVIQNEDVMRFT